MTMGAEKRLRFEINKCRNCEACRDLLGVSCLVFPEMFNMVDQERDTGQKVSTEELNRLADICNFCGACPCLDIRVAILEYKTEQADRNGLPLRTRMIENVERIGKIGNAFPQAFNFILTNKITRNVLQRTIGIHEKRKMPVIEKEGFATWFKKRSVNGERVLNGKRKLAYFAGCSARFLFPDVGKALVNVLERNGCEVEYLPQRCCGMPSFLEGDRKKTLALAAFNVDRLTEVINEGYKIVCSCPTCGYVLKVMLNGGFGTRSGLINQPVQADGYLKIPKEKGAITTDGHDHYYVSERVRRNLVDTNLYFSPLDPVKRKLVAENTVDAGEYLVSLHEQGELDTSFHGSFGKITYFPPCHQREQRIGQPYHQLMGLIHGVEAETISGDYCCGNGGIMGFKQDFFRHSLRIGGRLVNRLKSAEPDILTTDCLSCRMQFDQMTHYRTQHPLEILEASYEDRPELLAGDGVTKQKSLIDEKRTGL